MPCPNTLNTLIDQRAIHLIQRHHIGNRAKSHKVKPRCHGGFGNILLLKPIFLSQFGAQCTEKIKGNTDTGETLTGKVTARLVRINNSHRRREHSAGQMMVSDNNVYTQPIGVRHTFNTGNTVINGNNQIRGGLLG